MRMGDLAPMFGFSLGLTVVIELAAAFLYLCFASRGAFSRSWNGSMVLLLLLVNLLTNPPAVLLCWLGSLYLPVFTRLPLETAVEALVILVEGAVFRSFAEKPQWQIPGPFILAAVINISSWLIGRML